jgi:hypothetical protein
MFEHACWIQTKPMVLDHAVLSRVVCHAAAAAGLLAMWLQHKQKQAALAKVALDPSAVSQAAAMRNLVSTAKGVKDPLKPAFLEPVARMGAGRAGRHVGTSITLLATWSSECCALVTQAVVSGQQRAACKRHHRNIMACHMLDPGVTTRCDAWPASPNACIS